MKGTEYKAERMCENCDHYTEHSCQDATTKENHYQECMVCGWYAFGGWHYKHPTTDQCLRGSDCKECNK